MIRKLNLKIIAWIVFIFLGGVFIGYLVELLIPLFNMADLYNRWGFWGSIGRIGIIIFLFSVPLGYFFWLVVGLFQVSSPRKPLGYSWPNQEISKISQIKKILVPVGDGPNATLGLQLVSQLTNLEENGVITLFKVLPSSTASRIDQQKKQLENITHHSLLEFKKDFIVEVKVEVSNEVVKPIIDLAKEGQYDLLVVGASEGSHFGRFLFGSIPLQIAEQSPCPIVIIRGAAANASNNLTDT